MVLFQAIKPKANDVFFQQIVSCSSALSDSSTGDCKSPNCTSMNAVCYQHKPRLAPFHSYKGVGGAPPSEACVHRKM